MGSFESAETSERRGGQPGKIDAPLDKKLQAVKWGKFRLRDLFEKIKVNSLKYKTSTLPNIAEKEYDLPALTAGIQNQGLNNYVPRENATVLKNVISISANGANTGATFYQSKEFTVLQDAYAIRWMYSDKILTDDQSLFLVSAISKSIYGSYEWTNKAGWERIKNDTIQLPLTPTGEIDFDFMESFIREIEAERMRELNAYLQTTGLKDYALTVAEQKVLEEFEHLKWGKFRLGDLFEKIKVNSLKYKTSTLPNIAEKEYDLPALTAGIQNQGLNNYVPRENATVLKNVISISANGANTGATFYQSKEFTVLQDAYAIRWMYSDKILTDDQSLFLVSAISKSIYGSYEWTNKAGWERIKNDTIQLPLTPTGEIDFDFMETFIKAIEKLVIKDVVQYTDKRVAATARMVK